MKIRRHRLKYVLRQLSVDYLPEQIVKREKQGFMFPIAHWFRNELYPFIERSLLDSYFVREGIFRQDTIVRMLEEHRRNHVDHHVRLWMLLNLELWHQMYLNRDDVTRAEQKMQSYL